MAVNIPKKHHYVPRSYLKRFSFDEKHVFILRKNDNKPISVSVEGICAERDFYSMFNKNKTRNVNVEKIYSKLEDNFPNKIFGLIPKDLLHPYRDGAAILNPTQKTMLIEAILLQIIRGKVVRDYGQSVAEQLYWDALDEIKKKFKNSKETASQFEFLEQNKDIVLNNAIVGGSILPFIKRDEHSELRKNLQNRNCIIFMNRTGVDLITSDDPILIGDESGRTDKIFNYPLGDPNSFVYYPLDPKHLVLLCTQERCRGECDIGMVASLSAKDADLIKNLNAAQYRHCVRCAIANNPTILRATKKITR